MAEPYCVFFETEDSAIEHCRGLNRGLSSKDSRCVCVIDGPGGTYDPEWCPGATDTVEANYAVVDLETARDLTDLHDAPYLIVT